MQDHFTAAIVEDGLCYIWDNGAMVRHPIDRDGCAKGSHAKWYKLHRIYTRDSLQLVSDRRAYALQRRRAMLMKSDKPDDANVASRMARDAEERLRQSREAALIARSMRLQRPLPPASFEAPHIPSAPTVFHTWDRVLPEITWLRQLNEHPRDHRLVFIPETHRYLMDGAETHGSVTGLIHAFSHEFDAMAVIDKMMHGQNWPRPGYLRADIASDVLAGLHQIPECHKLLALLAPALDEEAICAAAKDVLRHVPSARSLIEQVALSRSEIEEKWERARTTAANQGTYMHFTFEAWINRVPISDTSPELKLLIKYASTLAGLTAYRTEWTIFGAVSYTHLTLPTILRV